MNNKLLKIATSSLKYESPERIFFLRKLSQIIFHYRKTLLLKPKKIRKKHNYQTLKLLKVTKASAVRNE